MSVEELETAVSRLSRDELVRFSEWFKEFIADEWDQQIEADAEAGRLDALIREAEGDIAAGRVHPLP